MIEHADFDQVQRIADTAWLTDGAGNVWVSWFDSSPGLANHVARRSGDSGATFGSIYRLDRPVIVAYLMVIVVMFVLINLAVDLIYMALDPRVRLTERSA